VRQRDLGCHERLVVGDVRQMVMQPVLEFDLHPDPQLLDVEGCLRPYDADLLADASRFVGGEGS